MTTDSRSTSSRGSSSSHRVGVDSRPRRRSRPDRLPRGTEVARRRGESSDSHAVAPARVFAPDSHRSEVIVARIPILVKTTETALVDPDRHVSIGAAAGMALNWVYGPEVAVTTEIYRAFDGHLAHLPQAAQDDRPPAGVLLAGQRDAGHGQHGPSGSDGLRTFLLYVMTSVAGHLDRPDAGQSDRSGCRAHGRDSHRRRWTTKPPDSVWDVLVEMVPDNVVSAASAVRSAGRDHLRAVLRRVHAHRRAGEAADARRVRRGWLRGDDEHDPLHHLARPGRDRRAHRASGVLDRSSAFSGKCGGTS